MHVGTGAQTDITLRQLHATCARPDELASLPRTITRTQCFLKTIIINFNANPPVPTLISNPPPSTQGLLRVSHRHLNVLRSMISPAARFTVCVQEMFIEWIAVLHCSFGCEYIWSPSSIWSLSQQQHSHWINLPFIWGTTVSKTTLPLVTPQLFLE